MNKIVAGIDAGSTAIKVTLYDGNTFENILGPTGWNPREAANLLLEEVTTRRGIKSKGLNAVFGTGYGRKNLSLLTRDVTEISCHARGAKYLCPEARMVIDIGGQDAKAIKINGNGKVVDFIMNDKCAAGTGRFLQVMANAMGLDIDEMAKMKVNQEESCKINSMCTVFAESEVIGLIHKGNSREAIVSGLYKSIAKRIGAMTAQVSNQPPIVFTGGVSRNTSLHKVLEDELKAPLIVPNNAIFAGSIGAAIFAWESIN